VSSFKATGRARASLPVADAEFRAQPIPGNRRKPGGRILKKRRRVDGNSMKRAANVVAFRYDRFRVARAVPVDMLDRFVDAVHDL